MTGHVFGTEAEARRAIRAIDEARGPFETHDSLAGGRVVSSRTAPALPWWGSPVPLRDGTFAVPWEPARLASIEGRSVVVDGQKATCPLSRDAVTLDATRLPPEPASRQPARLGK